mgnify:CR=1 FL=1
MRSDRAFTISRNNIGQESLDSCPMCLKVVDSASERTAETDVGAVAVGVLHELQVVGGIYGPILIEGMAAAQGEVDTRSPRC